EDSVIDSYKGPIKWLWMLLFHGLPWLAVCGLVHIFGLRRGFFAQSSFWIKFFIGFGTLALTRSFIGYESLMDLWKPIDYFFFARCFNRASHSLIALPIFLLFYYFYEKERPRNWYGLSRRGFEAKPYVVLLGLAAGAIFVGSFISELSNYYPRYDKTGLDLYLGIEKPGIAKQVFIALYEVCYGSSFLAVELIFRGFLILAFTHLLGPQAVLPMVITYAFLHFGKPVTETLSSIFGGYILGIISYYSRNIWGGVFIHVGVAWLMEIFGWLQNAFWK
ncbi:MAG: CPBP family intramembrane glutamic endopeptidase, partial [Bacteroidota bacterium]